MTARRRLAISAGVALLYALALLRLTVLDAPRLSVSRHLGFASGQFVFALVELWAGLGISWSQRAVALGIAAAVALVTNLSRELLGYVFMGVSVFATIVAWQYVTGPVTVAALTAAQPAAMTMVRYRMLAAWLFLTVAFATPLIRWLQPPLPVFLLGLILLPMVPCD